MSTEIVDAIVENKCCIRCCPKRNVCLSCGKLEITYSGLFAIQIIFSTGLHFFDIGSDLFVLADLHSKNYDYFKVCLSIIVISFTFSAIIGSIQALSDHATSKLKKIFCCLIGILQLSMITETYYSIVYSKKTIVFSFARKIEALLESCPQSLFQLFVTLKNAETYSFQEISLYYISISISLINVAVALVTFEF